MKVGVTAEVPAIVSVFSSAAIVKLPSLVPLMLKVRRYLKPSKTVAADVPSRLIVRSYGIPLDSVIPAEQAMVTVLYITIVLVQLTAELPVMNSESSATAPAAGSMLRGYEL